MPSDRDDEIENGKSRGGLSDMMKKALFASIGAVFMTEESVRNYVSDAKLPREIRNYLIQNAAQAKEQFFDYLSKELTQVILRSDLPKVMQKFLIDHTIELEAKIRFKSNGTPEISGSAKALPPAIGATGAPTGAAPVPSPAGAAAPPAPAPAPSNAAATSAAGPTPSGPSGPRELDETIGA